MEACKRNTLKHRDVRTVNRLHQVVIGQDVTYKTFASAVQSSCKSTPSPAMT